jgi:hypothetical protein
MQSVEGLAPLVAVDQVVPVGDEVPERAPLVAERDAAVHAAGSLVLELHHGEAREDFFIVLAAFLDGPITGGVSREFHESGGLTHD